MLFVLVIAITLFEIKSSPEYGFGIDWGAEYHKSTILIPGEGFRMVENEISKRKTPSIIAFCGGSRFFENQAIAKFSRQNCVSFHLLNLFFSDIENEHNLIDKQSQFNDQFGVIFSVDKTIMPEFKRTKLNKLIIDGIADVPLYFLRLEEIFAMMLEKERDNAGKTGNNVFTAVSFTIWDNSLSIPSRKQLLAAIKLSGLKPVGFIHENTAALTYLSMDRQVEKEKKPENILIVNAGSSGLKLTLAKFETFNQYIETIKKTNILPAVTVIKDLFTADFAGSAIDSCLSDFVLKKNSIVQKKTTLSSDLKLFQKKRLMLEINKAKELLSANKEIQFTIEDFFDEGSLSIKLSRSEMEENCAHIFERLKNILTSFLDKTSNVDRIEAIGGIIRIQKVQDIIKSVVNLPIGARINGDEGSAMGASLFAANITSGLKLKKIIINDGPNHAVNLKILFPKTDSNPKETELFSFKTNYGSIKKINIKSLATDFIVQLTVLPGNYNIEYNVTKIEKVLSQFSKRIIDEWKVHLVFELDMFGIPKLSKAELLLRENITETVNKTLPKSSSGNETNNSSTQKYTLETKLKTVLKTEALSVLLIKETYKALHEDKELFAESQSILKSYIEKENKEKQLAKLKNKLETFVYFLRSSAKDSESSRFLSEEEGVKFLETSETIEVYLNEKAFEQKKIEKMIFEAEKLSDLLSDRKNALNQRENTWKNWISFHKNVTFLFEKLKSQKSFVEKSVFEKIQFEIDEAKSHLTDLHQKQKSIKMHENPVFSAELVKNKINRINELISGLEKMTKPIVKNEKNQKSTNKTNEKSKVETDL